MDIDLQNKCDTLDYDYIETIVIRKNITFDQVLQYACYSPIMPLVEYIITRKKDINWNEVMFFACLSNNNELIEMLLPRITNHYEIFNKLCYIGNMTMVMRFTDIYLHKLNINHGMIEACVHGHTDIINFLLEKHANDYMKSLQILSRYGHLELSKQMLIRTFTLPIDTEYADILRSYSVLEACRYGHVRIFNMFVDNSILFDIKKASVMAKKGNHVEIYETIQFLIKSENV